MPSVLRADPLVRPVFATTTSRTIFGGTFEPTAAPPASVDMAPERPVSTLRTMPPVDATPLGLRINRLRKAAVFDILDQIGIDLLPSHIWLFVGSAGDVADGVEEFFRAIGIKPALLKSRDAVEIERANEVLHLLASIGSGFDRLDAAVQASLQRQIFAGDFDRVREALTIVEVFAKIRRVADRWTSGRHLASFKSFLKDIDAGLADPLSFELDDARAAEELVGQFSDLMSVFHEELVRHDDAKAALTLIWPSAWGSGVEADILAANLGFFENAVAGLERDDALTFDDIAEVVNHLSAGNDELESLVAKAHAWSRSSHSGGRKSKSGGRRSGPSGSARKPSERDSALMFFGFAVGSSPTAAEIDKSWKKVMKERHPDLGGQDPDERARREAACKQANYYRDFLKRGL